VFEKICLENDVNMEFETIWVSPAVTFDPVAVGFVKEAVKEAGYETALVSGAGHDRFDYLCQGLISSVYTARKVPTAMVFVRCKDGISHHPAEYSSPEDWYAFSTPLRQMLMTSAIGAQVLLGAYLRYDAYLRQKHGK